MKNIEYINNKWIFSFLLASLFSFRTIAQDNDKVFEPSPNEGWLVNVNEAYELSQKTNKPILANFTGSDWCGWCKRLKAEVFSKSEFQIWAKDNLILLELDFPRRKKLPDYQALHNQELQSAFKISGFPTLWLFTLHKPEGSDQFQIEPHGKTGYTRGGPSAFIKSVEKMIPNN